MAEDKETQLLIDLPSSTTYYTNPKYKEQVHKVFNRRMDESFNFNDLRRLYARTSHYDPMADHAKARLSEISFDIIYKATSTDTEHALSNYDKIIKAHLGNINVITLAIALSKEDSRFGDPEFFQWISQGIMKVVKRQGDGSSFASPYIIVASNEEDLLFKSLDLQPIRTEFIPYGDNYYNIHTVRDHKKNKEYEIFIDVTLPFERAKNIHDQKGKTLDLTR